MAVLLITYDLNNEVRRPPITKKIKELFPEWAKLSESSYAIQTDMAPQQIYSLLAPMIDGDDTCIVLTLATPWWGKSKHDDVIPWLKSRL